MAPTREMSVETKERIIKLLQDGKSSRNVANEVGCSQSAVSKIWTKYKSNGKVVKGKRTGRPRKTSMYQDKKLKEICLENRKCTTKQMRNKWSELGVNVCDRTVRHRLKEMGLSAMEKKLAEYKCNTNEAIKLKLVRFPEDIDDDSTTFNPEFSHQIFGDDEVAFGYKGLQILLYHSAGNLSPMFRVQYSAKVDDKFDGVQADDVENKIREIIPPGFCCGTDDFITLLEKEVNFKPFGTICHSYNIFNEDAGEEITYQICKADMTCPGFREYHERLQTFLMWFIETASYIDVDDERWDYFLVFEKYNKDGTTLFATVGYMTVYNYYVYPDKTRPRVSQMLILPPFQGEGHGAQLLETVHRYYVTSPNILDVTAEDPSENFVRLRDFVLAKLCQNLPCFSPEKLLEGFSQEMVTEAQQKLKINKQHARRVYEILRLRATDMSDPEKSRAYRLEIKKRLVGPYKKNQREMAKMRRCLKPEELTNQMNQIDLKTQHEQLEESYQELVTEYRRTVERLAQV